MANSNQTALYSLNRIGDHGNRADLGTLGNGLILMGGSTLVMDSAAIELANYKSVDDTGNEVPLNKLSKTPNTVWLTTGTVFRVSCKLKTAGSGEASLKDRKPTVQSADIRI